MKLTHAHRLACHVLWGLSYDPKVRDSLIAQGFHTRIMAAMDAHPEAPFVQHRACDALRSLAYGSRPVRRLLVEAGALPRVLAAQAKHASYPRVAK